MINLAVINLKTVDKKMIRITIKILCLLIIFFMIKKVIALFNTENYMTNILSSISLNYKKIIDGTVTIFGYTNKNEIKKESSLKKMLVSELTIFSAEEEELMEAENQEEVLEFSEEELKENKDNKSTKESEIAQETQKSEIVNVSQIAMEEVPLSLPTKVINTNNKTDTFTNTYGSVKIKNESKYPLTAEMVTPNIEFTNKKDVIIYHTHTCESYTPTAESPYQASGNFRTIDLNYSVARVGKELTNLLKQKGLNAIQNTTYHDYPAYSGSYTRALSTITGVLQQNPNTQFVIDLHRDALGSNSAYSPSVQIGDEICAQLMFVMGTDGGGLNHPEWLNNFKLAIKIQEKANEMYPGLFKPIILRNSRYNQHVTTGACIIEVGATGNTIEQCNNSMKYLANVIAEVMK